MPGKYPMLPGGLPAVAEVVPAGVGLYPEAGRTQMTSQEKKAWLGRYRQLDQRIGQLAEEISLWRSRAQKITPSYEGQPRGGGEDRLQSAVEMILQLEKEADREIDALVGLKGEIRRAIRTVEDSTLRLLLEYRYIHGLTWEQIADRMSYNDRWVRRLHGKALEMLETGPGKPTSTSDMM
nr:MAG TPA: RNA polymerase sigma factor [Bacteriophage sp.]